MGARQPRIECGGVAWVVAPGLSWTGRAWNLSVGGAFIADCPAPALELEAGRRLSVSIDIGDARPAIAAHARVVWARRFPDVQGPAGVAVRFVRIEEADVRRIAQLITGRSAAREERLRGQVRLKLPGLPSRLRAVARAVTPGTMVLEADLSWLKLGTALSAEVSPGDVRDGRLTWVAVEVTPAGHARLCLHVELVNRTVELVAEPEDIPSLSSLDEDGVDEETVVMAAYHG